MPDESQLGSAEDQRLHEAIAAYLDAWERRRPVDRARFLAEHPGLTRQLQAFLAD